MTGRYNFINKAGYIDILISEIIGKENNKKQNDK